MRTGLFRPHIVGAIVFYFWAVQILPLRADTPLFWFDPSTKLMDHLTNREPDESVPDQSVEKSFYEATHHGGILLVPKEDDNHNEFNLHFQGILTDNLVSEIDGILEYNYDLINYETSINVKTSLPLLVSYDNRKAQIIELTGKGHILTNKNVIKKHDLYNTRKNVFDELSELNIANVDRLPHIRDWQVYMMSSSGDDRNEKNDRNDENDKKRTPDEKNRNASKKKKGALLCSRCNTQRYVVGPDISGGNDGNACLYYGSPFFLHLAVKAGHYDCQQCPQCTNSFSDQYPPCSFYAELDTENSDQPAINNNRRDVFAAITQWRNSRPGEGRSQNEAQPQPERPQQDIDSFMSMITIVSRLTLLLNLSEGSGSGHSLGQSRAHPEPEISQEGTTPALDEEERPTQEDAPDKPD